MREPLIPSWCSLLNVMLLLQAWEATLAALGSKSVGAGAVSAFGRILSGYARRAGSWDEVARLLAAVPMFKVRRQLEPVRGGLVVAATAWLAAGCSARMHSTHAALPLPSGA